MGSSTPMSFTNVSSISSARFSINRIVLFGMFSVTALSKNFLFTGISIADLALVIFILLIIIKIIYNNEHLYLPKSSISLIIFHIWVLLGAIYLSNLFPFSIFSFKEFFNSFAKLFFYSFIYLMVYHFLSGLHPEDIKNIILNVLLLNAVLSFYIYFAMILPELNLPYKFLWIGQSVPETTGYFRGSGFVRARGIFTEPAVLGFFQGLGLAFTLFWDSRRTNLIWKHYLIILSMLLTISLSTYFLLSMQLGLYILKRLKDDRNYLIPILKIIIFVILFTAILLTVSTLWRVFYEGVLMRLEQVIYGQDGSAIERLIGSWELSLVALKNSPIFGSGLGNLEVIYPDISYMLKYKILQNGNVTNVLAYILGTLGFPGLIIFILTIYVSLARNKTLAWIFFVAMFTTGNFLDTSFWMFLALYSLPNSGQPFSQHANSDSGRIKMLTN